MKYITAEECRYLAGLLESVAKKIDRGNILGVNNVSFKRTVNDGPLEIDFAKVLAKRVKESQ